MSLYCEDDDNGYNTWQITHSPSTKKYIYDNSFRVRMSILHYNQKKSSDDSKNMNKVKEAD